MSSTVQSVYVSWQSQASRKWYVIGHLKQSIDKYEFKYTKGAQLALEDSFKPFSGMEEMTKVYLSDVLFPIFKNRVLSKKRPDYPIFIQWLRLDDNADEMSVLERSNGIKETDSLQTFNPLRLDRNNNFECYFFLHGLRHRTEEAKKIASELKNGDRLEIQRDENNLHDICASKVLDYSENHHLGFCTRYLSKAISTLLDNKANMILEVESIDTSAPISYRLMCKLSGSVPLDFDGEILNSTEYEFLCDEYAS